MNNTPLSADVLDKMNASYQKVVDTIISLASAALVLPVLILRDFMGIDDDKALMTFLNWKAWIAWMALGLSIALGAGYYFSSAKWTKNGQPISPNNRWVRVLDWTFWSSVVMFILGIGMLMAFLVTFKR